GASAVIVMSLFYNTIKQIQPNTDIKQVIVTNIKDYLPPLAAFLFTVVKEKKEGHRIERKPEDHDFLTLIKQYEGRKPTVVVNSDDVAIFQYTGGTTGGTKAAMGTHQALVSNVLQTCYWLGQASGENVLAGAIPFFHVYGMVAVLSAAAYLKASV